MKSFGNVAIFGDSYSTYEGYIPDGYAIYYTVEQADSRAYVDSVDKTWWMSLINETGSKFVFNNSWSGSTVCYTGYNGVEPEQSFVYRAKQYLIDGYHGSDKIDTVFVFGGTNDNWGNSPLGEPKYSDFTEKDMESFFPALCFLITYLRKNADGIRIINITNTELKDEVTNGIAEICKKLNVENVVLHDIDKFSGHPTELGMEQIKNQILEQIQ